MRAAGAGPDAGRGRPPTNDDFADAQVIAGLTGSVSGSTVDGTKEPGEPDQAGNPGGASVWYVWTAPAEGLFSFDTCGSGFDTLLAVYTGTAVDLLAGTEAESDDDTCGAGSQVFFTAVAATQYRIAIDGFNGATGAVVLTWGQVAPPANDSFASAVPITGASGSVGGSNAGATKEPGEPNHAGNAGGASVWYAWTAPADGLFRFDTCDFPPT